MSRVGEKPVTIPEGVVVKVERDIVNCEGTLGKESIKLFEGIKIKIEDNILYVLANSTDSDRKMRALHGLSRALIANMITGVSRGFEKELEIVGVGYRASQEGTDIVFQLGFSHTIKFTPPKRVTVEILEPTRIKVKGISKQEVGQAAANIRNLRPPEPYKGKGIRYKGEYIRKKAGKAGKK